MMITDKDGREIGPVQLDRMVRLEAMADRYFMLALDLPTTPATRDGLGPRVVEARMLALELAALWEDA